ncbi:MAG: hypothetical protein QOG96_5752 [Pseudonocardiales bacterium]|nr:hypothetical protein [Pseudonocardiales bacterium]
MPATGPTPWIGPSDSSVTFLAIVTVVASRRIRCTSSSTSRISILRAADSSGFASVVVAGSSSSILAATASGSTPSSRSTLAAMLFSARSIISSR